MKNLNNLIKKKQISSLHFTLFILLFKSICFINVQASVVDTEGLEDLSKRLELYPPSQDDYLPIFQTIGDQLSALRLKDNDRAYFYYTSEEFQKNTSLQDFNRIVRANSVLVDNKSITVIEVRIDKNFAYYTGKITSTTGESRTINLNLIYENSAWKIHSMLITP